MAVSFGCKMAVVAVGARKAGRQLPAWQEIETMQLNGASLRSRAGQWLEQENKMADVMKVFELGDHAGDLDKKALGPFDRNLSLSLSLSFHTSV